MRFLIFVIFAFASLAQAATPVGSGDSISVARGNGVDLLVWRDPAANLVKAMRFSATGLPGDAVPIILPFTAGSAPSVAWDGSGFVVVWATSSVAVARIAAGGGTSFAFTIPVTQPAGWATIASTGAGSSLVAWGEGDRVFATNISSTGEVSLLEQLSYPLVSKGRLAREGGSYVLGWVGSCGTAPCPPQTNALVQRLNENGTATQAAGSLSFAHSGASVWSFIGGKRALMTVAPDARPTKTTVLSFDPGEFRAARTTIRFPEPLIAQETTTEPVLLGLGARINLDETGAPLTMNWSPLPAGQRLAAVLPTSGMRVLTPESGAGTIAIEAPATDVTEVGLTKVFVLPSTVWLKIDNRGPDLARVIDLWVTLPVKHFASAARGTLTRFGSLSRIRFEPNLIPGAGFEVAMYFDTQIDPDAVEGWVLISGTDRVISNNYVSTLPEDHDPEPEPPARRRLVGR